jgi:hypothetical protein
MIYKIIFDLETAHAEDTLQDYLDKNNQIDPINFFTYEGELLGITVPIGDCIIAVSNEYNSALYSRTHLSYATELPVLLAGDIFQYGLQLYNFNEADPDFTHELDEPVF